MHTITLLQLGCSISFLSPLQVDQPFLAIEYTLALHPAHIQSNTLILLYLVTQYLESMYEVILPEYGTLLQFFLLAFLFSDECTES